MGKTIDGTVSLAEAITSRVEELKEEFDIDTDAAMELLARCMARNLVCAEIMDMARFIVEND